VARRPRPGRARGGATARALAFAFTVGALALSTLAALSCGPSQPVDTAQLRVFYTSDQIGYLEPCG